MKDELWKTLSDTARALEEEEKRLTEAVRDGLWAAFPAMTVRQVDVRYDAGSISVRIWAEGEKDRAAILHYLASEWGLLVSEDQVSEMNTHSDGKVPSRKGLYIITRRPLSR